MIELGLMENTNPRNNEGKCKNIGIIGCGHISNQYLANLSQINDVQVIACSDIDIEKAKNQSRKYGIPKTLSTEEILTDKQNALVGEPGCPEDIAKNIETALSDTKLSERIASRAYADVQEYTWEKRARRILNLPQARGSSV